MDCSISVSKHCRLTVRVRWRTLPSCGANGTFLACWDMTPCFLTRCTFLSVSLSPQSSTCLSLLFLALCTRVGSRVTSPSSIPSLQLSGSSCCLPTWPSAVCSSWLQGPYITSQTSALYRHLSCRAQVACHIEEFFTVHNLPQTLWQGSSDWLALTWVIRQTYNTVLQVNLKVIRVPVFPAPGWALTSGTTLTRVCESAGTCWRTSTPSETACGSLSEASCSRDRR